MHKRGEEESAVRVERVETTVRADLWQKESNKSETEGLKMVVRPAVIYGLEMVALTEVAELKMLRFLLGVIRMDKIISENISRTAQIKQFGDRVRKVMLRWFGLVMRRDSGYIWQNVMNLELLGRRKRRRSQRRWMRWERTCRNGWCSSGGC